jgi:hypothetical protein
MDRYLAIAHRVIPAAGSEWPLSEMGRIIAVHHAADVIRAEMEQIIGDLKRERDEADRAAGEAQRQCARAEATVRAYNNWTHEAREAAGAGYWTSFDEVWKEALSALIKSRSEAK